MWESSVDGRTLTFHLAGINNQNFIMRDDETGTWWQQVSGEAIHGPLKGKRLAPVFCDELSYALWKRDYPRGRVLRPDDRVKTKYEDADWEDQYAKLRVVTPTRPDDKLAPRALIVGLSLNGKASAYPVDELRKQSPILDDLGGVPILVALGEDQKSVRAFERVVDGRTLELFAKPNSSPVQFLDAETATVWDFSGKGISGPHAGKQLKKINALKDYWFDWKIYNPETQVYALGSRRLKE